MRAELSYYPAEISSQSRLVEYQYPLQEYRRESKQLTYTLEFDVDAYSKIRELSFSNPEAYQKQKEALNGTTTFNLVTTLAERLNAALSRRIDVIDDEGVMRDSHQGKPLIEWYEKGRLARLEQGSSPHDQLREEAEIVGQEKIQEFFADAPVGSFAFFISRPGNEGLPKDLQKSEQSIYNHSFIDISQKTGENEITVMRCMSNLSRTDALNKIRDIKPDYQLPEDATDVELLAHPVTIAPSEVPFQSVDDLHSFFHDQVADSLSEEEFEIVKKACMPYIRRYLLVVENTSYVTDTLKRSFNAILNKADEVVEQIRRGRGISLYQENSDDVASERDMYLLGSMEVRSVDTGCGFSGGFAVGEGNNSPFGVLDAVGGFWIGQERDQYGSLYFECPSCKKTNKRPSGTLIPNCLYCHVDVSCGNNEGEEKKKKELQMREQEEKKKELEEGKRLAAEEERKKKMKKKENGLLEILVFSFQNDQKKDKKITA